MAIEGVVPTDGGARLLEKIIASSRARLGEIIENGDLTDKRKARGVMSQLEELEKRTKRNVENWVRVEIPYYYEKGMFESIKDTFNSGNEINFRQSFNQLHLDAIEAISRETYAYMSDALTGISKTGDRLINEATQMKINELIGTGMITGDTRKEISKNIMKTLKQQGITAIRDRAGKQWDLDAYTRMLTRTKLTQAHNAGTINRTLESGYDLVVVSEHAGSCPLCAPWQGKVYTITGRSSEYPSLDTARSGGLFHPNCRHKTTTYHEVRGESKQKFKDVKIRHNRAIEPMGGEYLHKFGEAIDNQNRRSFAQLLTTVGASFVLYEALVDLYEFL